jgi:hypothetical protein
LSSSDQRVRRLVTGLVLAALATSLSACGGNGDAASGPIHPTSAVRPADATTKRIAEVEFQRQCAIGSASFPDESGITADLDTRLSVVGLTHEEWKRWHDALVSSPALVAQLRTVSSAGCPAA